MYFDNLTLAGLAASISLAGILYGLTSGGSRLDNEALREQNRSASGVR